MLREVQEQIAALKAQLAAQAAAPGPAGQVRAYHPPASVDSPAIGILGVQRTQKHARPAWVRVQCSHSAAVNACEVWPGRARR